MIIHREFACFVETYLAKMYSADWVVFFPTCKTKKTTLSKSNNPVRCLITLAETPPVLSCQLFTLPTNMTPQLIPSNATSVISLRYSFFGLSKKNVNTSRSIKSQSPAV